MTSAPVGFWHWHWWHVRGLWQRSGVEHLGENLSSMVFLRFLFWGFWRRCGSFSYTVSLMGDLGEFLKLISICSISIPVQLKVLGYDWVLTSLFRWYLSHNDGTERNRRNHEPLQACCDLMMQVLQLGEGGDLWFLEEVFCSTNGYLPEVWQLAPEKLLGPNRKVVFLSHHFSGVYVKLWGCNWWFGGLDPLMKGSVTSGYPWTRKPPIYH